MPWLARLIRRCRLLIRRRAVEQAMDAELRHHIDCEIDHHVRRGLAPAEARRLALCEFGGIEAIKEEGRDARGTRAIEDLAADLRYGARLLRRHPGFTTAAVLTFALGIGAATAIFSVVYGVLLRPLPYTRPDRLVALWEHDVPRNRDRNVVSLENVEAWRERARSFEGMETVMPTSATIAGGSTPERVIGAEITTGYFGVLGVRPALGRDFTQADSHDGLTIILSDSYWRRRFGGDPTVLGRVLTISGKAYTIVGVMPGTFDPPRFGWLGEQQVWFPFVVTPQERGWGRFLLVVARLREGVTLEQARGEMIAIAAQRALELPANNTGWSATVVPLAEQMTGDVRPMLVVLLGAVALLLTMAVTNVATLTLSTMRRRGQELAVRRAIGATDGRLFRQLFAQSALLAAIGTGTGLLVAPAGVRLLLLVLPPDIPRTSAIRVDGPVLLVTSVVAVLATLIFGSVAAIKGQSAARHSPAAQVGGETRASSRAGGGALVVSEIALALALGVMAVLMARSLAGLRAVNLGFDPGGVAVARVALPENRYPAEANQRAFFDSLLERVRTIPAVTSAGVISARPLGGLGPATTAGNPRAANRAPLPVVDVRWADAAAFTALRVPLEQGALFDQSDTPDRPVRVVIGHELAHVLWPRGDAVGRKMSLDLYNGLMAEVIGVVGDVHLMDPRSPPRPVAYLAASRFPSPVRDLVVRVDGAPESVVPALRSALAALDRTLPLYAVTTLPAMVDASLASDQFTTLLLGAFAVAALLLAAVGVFGVFAGDVTHRRKEIGIRLALGARVSQVVLLLLRRAALRAAVGVLLGTALALGLTQAMKSLLFGVRPSDPASFVLVVALVMALALCATLMPAIAAARRAPLPALREN